MDPWPESSSKKEKKLSCGDAVKVDTTGQNFSPPGSLAPQRFSIFYSLQQTKLEILSTWKKKYSYNFYPTQQTNPQKMKYTQLFVIVGVFFPGSHGCISCMQGPQAFILNLQLLPEFPRWLCQDSDTISAQQSEISGRSFMGLIFEFWVRIYGLCLVRAGFRAAYARMEESINQLVRAVDPLRSCDSPLHVCSQA